MKNFNPVPFGKYVLLERIGVGPTGELYRGHTTEKGDKKPALIKKLLRQLTADKESVASFTKAARISKLLKHPNIIRVDDFGSVDGTYYVATEYLSGRTLQEVLDASKEHSQPLELPNALYITAEICKGLTYAHNLTDSQGHCQNIIHRDISPHNIFVTFDGRVKITEFAVRRADRQGTNSQIGLFKGKMAYMSPEQVDGKAIDRRSDIFSLGAILYELTTAKVAFEGETIEIFSRVRQARYEPPENVASGLPPVLCQVIHRALEKDLQDRYPSAGDMLTELEEAMSAMVCRPTTSTLAQWMKMLFPKKHDAGTRLHENASQPFSKGLPVEDSRVEQAYVEKTTGKTKDVSVEFGKKTLAMPAEGSTEKPSYKDPGTPPDGIASQPEKAMDDFETARPSSKHTIGDPPVRSTTAEPDKPIVTLRAKEPGQSPLEVQDQTADRRPAFQENRETDPFEKVAKSRQPKPKTIVWAAVAAAVVILSIGLSLFLTKETAPTDPGAVASAELGAGVKALEAGRFDEAASLFDEVLASEPAMLQMVSKPYAEALQGQAAEFEKTDFKKAENLLLMAVKFDPQSVSAFSKLGLVYLRQKDFVRSAKSYETVLQLDGKSPNAFFNLGYIYAVQQDYLKAEGMYARVVELAPSFLDEALFNLATVQDRLGKRNECIKNMKLAIKANPKNKPAKQYLRKLKS